LSGKEGHGEAVNRGERKGREGFPGTGCKWTITVIERVLSKQKG
jgi:hypothetical protein